MERRVGIFYMSQESAADRHLVLTNYGDMVYIRVEVAANGAGLSEALDAARPRKDETLMNTHYLSGGYED